MIEGPWTRLRKRLRLPVVCDVCGERVARDAKSCSRCGADFTDPERPYHELRPSNPPNEAVQPPLIFVDADGEVTRLDSVERAEQYIEAVDVDANEYRGFDALGHQLDLAFGAVSRRSVGYVRVGGISTEANPEMLRRVLIEFRTRYGESKPRLEGLDLAGLIEGLPPS